MKKNEEAFYEIAEKLEGASVSKMFGATCIKAPNGKAVLMIYDDDLVIKLHGEDEKEALALDGAHYFTPMENRPMKGWVHLPPQYEERWMEFAEKSMAFVKTLKK